MDSENGHGFGGTMPCDQIVFAIAADGTVVHASDPAVKRGKACLCVCPNCGSALVAKKGEIRIDHFAHASGTSCAHARESALHKAAKQVLERASAIALPEHAVKPTNGVPWAVWPAGEFTYSSVRAEVTVDQFRPDIVISNGQHEVFVEVLVTHKCTPEKTAWAKSTKRNMVEIDLRAIPLLPSWDDVRQAVLTDTDNKAWVSNSEEGEILESLQLLGSIPKTPEGNYYNTRLVCPVGELTGRPVVDRSEVCAVCGFGAATLSFPQLARAGQPLCFGGAGIASYSDWLSAQKAGGAVPRHIRGYPRKFLLSGNAPAIGQGQSGKRVLVIESDWKIPPPPPFGLSKNKEEDWKRRYSTLVNEEGVPPNEAVEWMRNLKMYHPKEGVQTDLFSAAEVCSTCGAPMEIRMNYERCCTEHVCTRDRNHPRR